MTISVSSSVRSTQDLLHPGINTRKEGKRERKRKRKRLSYRAASDVCKSQAGMILCLGRDEPNIEENQRNK